MAASNRVAAETRRDGVDRDTEIGAELLCGHVQAALSRLEAGRADATGTDGDGKVLRLRR